MQITTVWSTMRQILVNMNAGGIHDSASGLVAINAREHITRYGVKIGFRQYIATAVHEWLHETQPTLSEDEVETLTREIVKEVIK